MPLYQVAFQAVRKAFHQLAKQLPKLWPLLLESRNREKIGELARDLAAQSPKKRLAAKIELTEALADSLRERATTEQERATAAAWKSRAQRMRVRLDMPVDGVKARRDHRARLRQELSEMHGEMDRFLGGSADGSGPG